MPYVPSAWAVCIDHMTAKHEGNVINLDISPLGVLSFSCICNQKYSLCSAVEAMRLHQKHFFCFLILHENMAAIRGVEGRNATFKGQLWRSLKVRVF